MPAELAAATRLTSLVLNDPNHAQLDVTNALPCSLRQLQLTEADELYDPSDSGDEWEMLRRDFGSLTRLQSLQLAAHEWAENWLPLGCVLDNTYVCMHSQHIGSICKGL